MFNTNDSNSIFGNLNKIVSTFIPADSRQDQENNQVIKPLKIIIYFFCCV
jgi:hypothetical protein